MDKSAAALFLALMYVFGRVGPVTINTENEQHHASADLQEKLVVLVTDKFHHEAHAQSGKQGIDYVAYGSPHACDKSEPPTFVKRPLYTQHTDRPHRSRRYDANENAFEYKV